MLIVDGHLDLAFNALHNRRDLTQNVQTLREREDIYRDGVGPQNAHPDAMRKEASVGDVGVATVALPELRAAQVGVVMSTIMARVQMPTGFLSDGTRTQAAAHAIGQSHLHYYKALERAGELRFIRTCSDLETAVTAWHSPALDEGLRQATSIGLVLSMESADPILGPDDVSAWYAAGLRSVSLTHFGSNTWGHGTGTKGGTVCLRLPPARRPARQRHCPGCKPCGGSRLLATARLLGWPRACQPLHVSRPGPGAAPPVRRYDQGGHRTWGCHRHGLGGAHVEPRYQL
jgi:membrane dipeptidase